MQRIRAILRNGVIHPLDSVPPQWGEGQELRVEEVESPSPAGQDDLSVWRQELEMLVAQLDDPREWEQLEAQFAEADKQAKAAVRRDMGLS